MLEAKNQEHASSAGPWLGVLENLLLQNTGLEFAALFCTESLLSVLLYPASCGTVLQQICC